MCLLKLCINSISLWWIIDTIFDVRLFIKVYGIYND